MVENNLSLTDLLILSEEVNSLLEVIYPSNLHNVQLIQKINSKLKRIEDTKIFDDEGDIASALFQTTVGTGVSGADQLFTLQLEQHLRENAQALREVIRAGALRSSAGDPLPTKLRDSLEKCIYALKRSLQDYIDRRQVTRAQEVELRSLGKTY